ncbi:DUF3426 domain-containing protein [Bordetella sp. LUAb4]|uniref:DUF3426 domain-containing protein n=1 Tax=Bordetella sp. LUAb4 TaxID=2843195 RepID=UPI001E5ED314|nr:DUF3426 domain-containing protein [Bordetella sp. LUAb4]
MALTTRCPHCGTAFKVVADQLRVRNGLVRCGVCARVFDGYEAIVDEDMPTLTPPAPPEPVAAAVVPPPAASEPPAPKPVVPPAVTPQVPPVVHGGHDPAPPWDIRLAPPTAPLTPAAPDAPSVVRDDISDAQLWAKEPVLAAEPPSVLRSRAEARRQEPTFIIRDEREDEDEPLDDDEEVEEDANVDDSVSAKTPPSVMRSPAGLGTREVSHGGTQGRRFDAPEDDPQVIRHRQRPIYVDPADDEYDDDLHGHPIADRDRHDAVDDRRPEVPGAGRLGSHDDPVYIYPNRDHGIDEDEDADPVAYTPVRGDARTRYDDDVDTGMAPPVFMDESRLRRAALIRRLWAVGCLLALCVLGLQGLYVYRSSVAGAVPALRPALQSVCGALGCEVGYARRLERISITASSLQPPSGAAAAEDGITRLVLSVTLRNRYDKPQPWPALVLELTDLSDTVVVRKVLRPEDYLPAGTRGAFPAGGEQSLSVPLRIAGAQVNGYQLDKFFP